MRVEDVRKVCVRGAGAMGAGIAQVCSQAGYAVSMRDIDHKFVEGGFRRILGPLMTGVEKGRMNVEAVEEEFRAKLGKEPVEVKEAPGFVVNRLIVPMMNEAFNLLQEGIASPEDIDKAMKLGTNMPMGAFEPTT